VAADELDQLRAIERLTQKLIERRYVDDFMPTHMLPDTTLDTRPIKPNKPKKPKAPRDQNGGKQNFANKPANAGGKGNANGKNGGRRNDRNGSPKADVTPGQGMRSKPLAPARRNRRPAAPKQD